MTINQQSSSGNAYYSTVYDLLKDSTAYDTGILTTLVIKYSKTKPKFDEFLAGKDGLTQYLKPNVSLQSISDALKSIFSQKQLNLQQNYPFSPASIRSKRDRSDQDDEDFSDADSDTETQQSHHIPSLSPDNGYPIIQSTHMDNMNTFPPNTFHNQQFYDNTHPTNYSQQSNTFNNNNQMYPTQNPIMNYPNQHSINPQYNQTFGPPHQFNNNNNGNYPPNNNPNNMYGSGFIPHNPMSINQDHNDPYVKNFNSPTQFKSDLRHIVQNTQVSSRYSKHKDLRSLLKSNSTTRYIPTPRTDDLCTLAFLNLDPSLLNKKILSDAVSSYGHLYQIRLLPKSSSAFLMFRNQEDAKKVLEMAMYDKDILNLPGCEVKWSSRNNVHINAMKQDLIKLGITENKTDSSSTADTTDGAADAAADADNANTNALAAEKQKQKQKQKELLMKKTKITLLIKKRRDAQQKLIIAKTNSKKTLDQFNLLTTNATKQKSLLESSKNPNLPKAHRENLLRVTQMGISKIMKALNDVNTKLAHQDAEMKKIQSEIQFYTAKIKDLIKHIPTQTKSPTNSHVKNNEAYSNQRFKSGKRNKYTCNSNADLVVTFSDSDSDSDADPETVNENFKNDTVSDQSQNEENPPTPTSQQNIDTTDVSTFADYEDDPTSDQDILDLFGDEIDIDF